MNQKKEMDEKFKDFILILWKFWTKIGNKRLQPNARDMKPVPNFFLSENRRALEAILLFEKKAEREIQNGLQV